MGQILFTPEYTDNYRDQRRTENLELRRKVMLGLVNRGIFLNPMGTKLYLSIKHNESHISELLDKLYETLKEIQSK